MHTSLNFYGDAVLDERVPGMDVIRKFRFYVGALNILKDLTDVYGFIYNFSYLFIIFSSLFLRLSASSSTYYDGVFFSFIN